jgi:hypothetical protein
LPRLAAADRTRVLFEDILLHQEMIRMKTSRTTFAGCSLAALLVIGSALPGFAQDAAAPQTPAAQTPAPPAAPAETQPSTVPRPSIVPKTAEPASPAADAEPLPRHRHYAYRHRRYGYYRTAYWEPFPVYWPHFYHNRIHWNRVPWFVRF